MWVHKHNEWVEFRDLLGCLASESRHDGRSVGQVSLAVEPHVGPMTEF